MTDQKLEETRAYYDDFARKYESQRRPNDPTGYHAMIDDLEVDFALKYARGKDVLEAGCGTGLILERLARSANRAEGFDLSPGMLEQARARGLTVKEGSLTDIPFPDKSFDVVCSFKVLAHVPDIRKAVSEMLRVTKTHGVVLAEFYNPWSLRGLVKRFGPAGLISESRKESDVYTRFDSPWDVKKLLPMGSFLIDARGVRIVTPAAAAMKVPGLRSMITRAEHSLADSPLGYFGGFWIAAIRKALRRSELAAEMQRGARPVGIRAHRQLRR